MNRELDVMIDEIAHGVPGVLERLLERCREASDDPLCEAILIAARRSSPSTLPYKDLYYRPWSQAKDHQAAWRRLFVLLWDIPWRPALQLALDRIIGLGWPEVLRQLPGEPRWIDRFCHGDADEPWMPLFRSLFFDRPTLTPALSELTRSPHLAYIRYLTFLAADLGWRTLEPTDALGSVSHLVVEGDPEGWSVDALTPGAMPALRHLGLVSSRMTDRHLEVIARTIEAGRWGRLTSLDLGMNPDLGPNRVTEEGVARLASAPAFSQLESLVLSSQRGLSDGAIIALAASPNVHHLRRLELDLETAVGDEAIIALAHSSHLRALEHLRVALKTSGGMLGIDEAEALLRARKPTLGTLELHSS